MVCPQCKGRSEFCDDPRNALQPLRQHIAEQWDPSVSRSRLVELVRRHVEAFREATRLGSRDYRTWGTFPIAKDVAQSVLCVWLSDVPYTDFLKHTHHVNGDWRDNTYLWGGGDVYKSIGERITNINGGVGALTSSFGTVGGFNTGFALGDSNIRGQIGASLGVYDYKGRIALGGPNSNQAETQTFFTAGVYKRGDMLNDCDRVSWGLVFDNFSASQWGVNSNEITLGQMRGVFGYALNERTEIGMFGTMHLYDDNAAVTVAGAPGVLRPIRAMNQANSYIKRNTAFGAQLTGYVGILDRADIGDWQFGLIAQVPVSHNWSVYSNFNYVAPSVRPGPTGSGEEQFNASVGLVYFFGGKSVSSTVSGQRGLPLLNVANNGSFLVTD